MVHPAAKMLVELSEAQDIEAGDGTTSVVVVAGSLLGAASELLERGIHPQTIARGFLKAVNEATNILESMAVPVELKDRAELERAVATSLQSKVVSSLASSLTPIAVDAVLKVIKDVNADNVDLNDIKVVKQLGGTVDDSELVHGLVLPNQRVGSKATRSNCLTDLPDSWRPDELQECQDRTHSVLLVAPEDGHGSADNHQGLYCHGQTAQTRETANRQNGQTHCGHRL